MSVRVLVAGVSEIRDVPSAEVDHSDIIRDLGSNLVAIEVKQGNFVICLVEFGNRNDVVPDEKAFVVVEQLIRQRGLFVWLVDSGESTLQSTNNTLIKLASANVQDIARGHEVGRSCHDVEM